jgi:hypothetical protein
MSWILGMLLFLEHLLLMLLGECEFFQASEFGPY